MKVNSRADRLWQCPGNDKSADATSESGSDIEMTLDIIDDSQRSFNNENIDSQQVSKTIRIWKLTLWLVLLFVYSTATKVSLELIDCQKIGSNYLSYFAPTYECFSDYRGYQYVVFMLVFAVVIFPGVVTRYTWWQSQAGRSETVPLSEPFKTEYCWWEGMLMTRRLVLTVCSVLPLTLIRRQAMMACICVVFCSIQTYCLPFKSSSVNLCESILMLFLAIISILSILKHQVCDISYNAHTFTLFHRWTTQL